MDRQRLSTCTVCIIILYCLHIILYVNNNNYDDDDDDDEQHRAKRAREEARIQWNEVKKLRVVTEILAERMDRLERAERERQESTEKAEWIGKD